jgi:outer membrane protein
MIDGLPLGRPSTFLTPLEGIPMKTILTSLILLMAVSVLPAAAQMKIGYFSSESVLKQMPDAQDAQKQLDQLVADWQSELTRMQDDWKKKLDEYDKRKLIMTDQRRSDSEKELRELDQKIVEFRTLKFGQNGELFQKQNELMKPVQDRIFKAVQEVAIDEAFDYIFDKSGDILLMYANQKYDLTLKVVDRLKVPTSPTK